MTEIVLASNNRKKIAELETLLEKCASKTISVKHCAISVTQMR